MAQTHTYDLTERLVDIAGRVRVFTKRVHGFSVQWPVEQNPDEAGRTESNAANVTRYELHRNHPLASISGLLEDHPLRDEYLEALGITE